jgi:ABC transporter substrate binding protein
MVDHGRGHIKGEDARYIAASRGEPIWLFFASVRVVCSVHEESGFVVSFDYCGDARCWRDSQGAASNEIPRVGYLATNSLSVISTRVEAFRQGLRELGYVEGKNIVIEWRFAEEKPDRLPALAAELMRLKVDIIVTAGPAVTRVAKEATVTIPIVMTFDNDPVGNGFVASLARPSGNITGLSTLAPELSGKQLELLKEIVPRLCDRAPGRTKLCPCIIDAFIPEDGVLSP